MKINAPFSPEQVKKLWEYQFGPWDNVQEIGHPYTCGNRSDGNHFDNGDDKGILVPTINGWICPVCDYKQDWCHEWTCNEK